MSLHRRSIGGEHRSSHPGDTPNLRHYIADVAGGDAQILERAAELEAVDAALRAAREGKGAVLLIEGAPGIGKTELLAAAMATARRRRMLVRSALGAELERTLSFAVVRQLFEPLITAADGPTRDRLLSGTAIHARTVVDPALGLPLAPIDPSAVLHGLYWLTVNIAAERPVVLVVDDLQWSDPASSSWLAYLARRIDGLALAVVLGTRSPEPAADGALLARLRTTDGVQRVTPAPLSVAAVGGLARRILGAPVEPAFSAACHGASGGNPFYATELLRALRQGHVAGTAADAQSIDGLTPRAVVDATLAPLGRMPSAARAVAEAVAVLEPQAEIRWIAELTGLDTDIVAPAADSLVALGMLRAVAPCRFEHPILRSAVESEIAPARRGLLHLKAAHALAAAGVPVEMVAAHLLKSPPSGDSWVVLSLQQGACEARARGALGGAVSYLERALMERPSGHDRAELLLELGRAEIHLQRPAASEHLREALALAAYPEQAAAVAFRLGQILFNEGEFDKAFELVEKVVARTDGHDGQRAIELQAFLLALAGPAGRMAQTTARAEALDARVPRDSPAWESVQASLALRDLVAGRPRERVRERAERAVAGLETGSTVGRDAPGMAFLWIDDLDRAEALFGEAIKAASQMGRVASFQNFSALRGYAVRRRGDLADAAADIEPVLAAAAQGDAPRLATLLALITQVMLLVDHATPDAAEALAAFAPIPATFERLPILALLRHAQGAAQLAQHKFAEAAVTLTHVGEVCDANGILSPAIVPWRSELALALASTDRHDEGIELALTELRLAEQTDVDRARGIALRALGLLEGGEAGLRRLESAVRTLERSPARLELAWASYELGAALRRAKRRRDARAPLDRALDLALACGAQLLAGRAGEELQALGARARSVLLTGAESLTPSERRVCRLAADGLRNGDIAQSLFVTLKTVETHLHSSYRKLDIAARGELPQALGLTRP